MEEEEEEEEEESDCLLKWRPDAKANNAEFAFRQVDTLGAPDIGSKVIEGENSFIPFQFI